MDSTVTMSSDEYARYLAWKSEQTSVTEPPEGSAADVDTTAGEIQEAIPNDPTPAPVPPEGSATDLDPVAKEPYVQLFDATGTYSKMVPIVDGKIKM